MNFAVGDILNGKVTGITKFGAFVMLAPGKSGLVHISEIANSYVSDVHDFLQEGQEVKVKIIGVDDNGRINLSIKKAEPPKPAAPTPPPAAPRPFVPKEKPVTADSSFEDKLKQFMADSDSKISGLYADKRTSRRRGGGRNN